MRLSHDVIHVANGLKQPLQLLLFVMLCVILPRVGTTGNDVHVRTDKLSLRKSKNPKIDILRI